MGLGYGARMQADWGNWLVIVGLVLVLLGALVKLGALGWLGNLLHAPVRSLGVTSFGESAALPDLYHKHRIDADAVLGAMAQLLFTT